MLNPYHLRYFCDACSLGGLAKAAEMNRVSHSAVSQAIRSLENSLGAKLLNHAKRRFEPTNQGRILFQHAQLVIDDLERVTALVRSAERDLLGPLRVGVSHSVAVSFLNRRVVEFCKKHPSVQPNVYIGNSATLERLLESRAVEIGFGVEDGTLVKFDRRTLSHGQFVLAASRYGKRPNPYIVGDKGLEVSALRAEIRKRKGREAKFFEVQSWSIIADMTAGGLGVGLLPDFVVRSRRDLRVLASKLNLPAYQLCAFFRSPDNLSPVARAFLQRLY